jgi:hypothetical protein
LSVRAKGAAIAVAVVLLACTQRETRTVSPPPRPQVTTPAASPSPPVIQGPVRTDRSSYTFHEGPNGPETTIVTTLMAPADRPLYLDNCNGTSPIGLQRLVGDQWVNAWVIGMNACYSEPIVLPAGKSRTGIITARWSGDAERALPASEWIVEAGTYRAVWYAVLSGVDRSVRPWKGENLPLEQRASAPFRIEAPPETPRESRPPSP